jgi:hypothetical protein
LEAGAMPATTPINKAAAPIDSSKVNLFLVFITLFSLFIIKLLPGKTSSGFIS